MNTIRTRTLEAQLMVSNPEVSSIELTKLLTLPPDEHWDAGQKYIPSYSLTEKSHKFSRWALRAEASSLDELDDAISMLLGRIRSIEDKFGSLPSNTLVSLSLFVTETNSVIGISLDTEIIKFLGRINAGIEISLVVDSCQDPPD